MFLSPCCYVRISVRAWSILLSLSGTLGLFSCNVPADSIRKGTVRVDASIADSFEVEASGFGLSGKEDVSYQSLEIGAGVTFLAPDPNGVEESGHRLSRLELVLGSVSIDDHDVLEFLAGGRVFFTKNQRVQPFVALHAVISHIDEIEGFEPGTQFGMRFGGGVEYALSDFVFIDAAVDYTIPIIAAESETGAAFGESIESELSGLALRVGVVF